MGPEYSVCTQQKRSIPAAAIRALYDETDWWPERSLTDIEVVVAGGPAVGAWLGSRLVGFARAVTDRRFRAYVEDVVVSPHHRGNGLATLLTDALLEELRKVDVVSLFCENALVPLYRRSGFGATDQRVLHRKPRVE